MSEVPAMPGRQAAWHQSRTAGNTKVFPPYLPGCGHLLNKDNPLQFFQTFQLKFLTEIQQCGLDDSFTLGIIAQNPFIPPYKRTVTDRTIFYHSRIPVFSRFGADDFGNNIPGQNDLNTISKLNIMIPEKTGTVKIL